MDIQCLASSSRGNCYLVRDGEASILLECGLPFREIRERVGFTLSTLDGVLISHEHGDHARAATDLLKVGVDVYTSTGTARALSLSGHSLHLLEPLVTVQVGPWKVLPFDTVHDAEEPLGFLLAGPSGGQVLYLTDTPYCKYRFKGLTHLMVECNHSAEILRQNVKNGEINLVHKNRVLTNHMGLERLLDLLKANDLSRVVEIHLLHLSDANSDAAAFKKAVAAATGKPVYVAPA